MTFRHSGLPKIYWIILAQRMPLKLIVEKNPPQVWMINEANTEKVPNLPFEKVRSRPKWSERFHSRIVLSHRHPHTQPLAGLQGVHMIDHRKAELRFLPIIHCGNVRKKIIVQSRSVLEKAKAGSQPFPREHDDIVAAKLQRLEDFFAQSFFDDLNRRGIFSHKKSIPLERAFFPHIDKADNERSKKDAHFDQAENSQIAEVDRPGIEKNHFNIKNQKQHRDEVKTNGELDARVASRGIAGFKRVGFDSGHCLRSDVLGYEKQC